MKHIIIGDLHGKDCWKEIDISLYDKIIFLGDYVDHWDLPDFMISQNLMDIIELKEKHPKKIELLLGNHDVQYLHYPNFMCSGFRPGMQRFLTYLFNNNRNHFNVAYQADKYIFSHAGITNSWFAEFLRMPIVQKIRDEGDTVADLVNKIEKTAQRGILHRAGKLRGGYGHGGITWADRSEIVADMLDGYHQVVGHTVISEVEWYGSDDKSTTFIDVLDHQIYFHEVDS